MIDKLKTVIESDEDGFIIADTETQKEISSIVKIENNLLDSEFFRISQKWTSFDLDWWTVIEAQIKDEEDNIVKVPIEKVKELMNVKRKLGANEFIKKSNDTLNKFVQSTLRISKKAGDKEIYQNINIFSQSYIDTDLYVTLQVNKYAKRYFNDFKNWTKFALEQSTQLHSTYAKKLFLIIKRWRVVGHTNFISLEDFREKLNVPKSYRPGNIDQKIIIPTLEELAPFFEELRVEKQYKSGKRGRSQLSGYIFRFKRETKNSQDVGVSQIINTTKQLAAIMTNPYLKLTNKYRAIDRYRGLKLGKTESFVKKVQPLTLFINAKDVNGRIPSQKVHRSELYNITGYAPDTLKQLALNYENLLRNAYLKDWDMDDLCLIETALYKKIHSDNFTSAMKESFYSIHSKTIAEKLPNNIEDLNTEISRQIMQQHAIYKRVIKHGNTFSLNR